MANLKNITELPVAESTDGLNVIVNDNGSAKQIAASSVGVTSWNNLTDKPFYEEVDTTAVFVEEEFELQYEEPSANVFGASLPFPVELGSLCDIVMNGVSYNDIVLKTVQTLYEGCTLRFAPTAMAIYVPTDVKELIVSLTVKNTTTHQIDEKFIPDSVKDRVFIMDMTVLTPDNFTDTTYGNTVKEALLNGKTVLTYDGTYYFNVIAFKINETTTGEVYLHIFTHSSNTTGGVSSTLVEFPSLLITL